MYRARRLRSYSSFVCTFLHTLYAALLGSSFGVELVHRTPRNIQKKEENEKKTIQKQASVKTTVAQCIFDIEHYKHEAETILKNFY